MVWGRGGVLGGESAEIEWGRGTGSCSFDVDPGRNSFADLVGSLSLNELL